MRVHLRRAILLFALVMGLTAVAASVAPPPPKEERADPAPAPTAPASRPAGGEAQRIVLSQPRRGEGEKRVAPGRHVIVQVESREPGEVAIPRLGLNAYASAGAPATFDLLAPAAGRYDVLFRGPGGTPARVGTLVVAPQ